MRAAAVTDAGSGPARPGPTPDPGVLAAALAELDGLVGLESVKVLLREFVAFATVQGWRSRAGLCADPLVLHMVFSGNPGTGKTTVARIVGRILCGAGLLSRGHLVEVERADLVGEYIGHTAAKAREVVRRALGGVLFIDEAYSLARGGERDFGREATDVLVKAMEDQREGFVLILAGYTAEMARFLRTNPGLRSRFCSYLEFPDYTPDELLAIADAMLARRQYRLTASARLRLAAALRHPDSRGALAAGNARLVRNLLERAIRRQAARIVREARGSPSATTLMDLLTVDLDGWRGAVGEWSGDGEEAEPGPWWSVGWPAAGGRP